MTRLISKRTRSSRAASIDGGTGESGRAGEVSIGVLAALLTPTPRWRSSSACAGLLCSCVHSQARSRCSLVVPADDCPAGAAVGGAAGPSPVPVSYIGRTGDRVLGTGLLRVT